jgi:iron complex outermembrane receptor protein
LCRICLAQEPKDTVSLKVVEIEESIIPQAILESPVTITKIDARSIAQLPQENFYAGLTTVKGVDVSMT